MPGEPLFCSSSCAARDDHCRPWLVRRRGNTANPSQCATVASADIPGSDGAWMRLRRCGGREPRQLLGRLGSEPYGVAHSSRTVNNRARTSSADREVAGFRQQSVKRGVPPVPAAHVSTARSTRAERHASPRGSPPLSDAYSPEATLARTMSAIPCGRVTLTLLCGPQRQPPGSGRTESNSNRGRLEQPLPSGTGARPNRRRPPLMVARSGRTARRHERTHLADRTPATGSVYCGEVGHQGNPQWPRLLVSSRCRQP